MKVLVFIAGACASLLAVCALLLIATTMTIVLAWLAAGIFL
jgi:hypothetical protein